MHLVPLEQWICGKCQQLIQQPEDGWFEWLDFGGDQSAHGFKIVHDSATSPSESGCHHYDENEEVSDRHLNDVIGPNLPALYSFLDRGPHIHPRHERLPAVRDLHEFMEILRRLTLPYYEEARQYFDDADEDGFFNELNEANVHFPERLRQIIAEYGEG